MEKIRLAAVKAAIERRLEAGLGEAVAVDYSDLVTQCQVWDIDVEKNDAGQLEITPCGLAKFTRLEFSRLDVAKMPKIRREFMDAVQEAKGNPLTEPKPPPPPEIDQSKIFFTGPEKTREEMKARFGVDPYTKIPKMMYDPRFFGPRFRGEI